MKSVQTLVVLCAAFAAVPSFAGDIFKCDAKDTFRHGQVLADLEHNHFSFQHNGKIETIYGPGVYCGHEDQPSPYVKCDFYSTAEDSDTFIDRILDCESIRPSGNGSALTTGTFYVNPQTGDGTLFCNVHDSERFNLTLSACKKVE